MQIKIAIELLGVIFGFLYLYLIIKENKWGWPFGIASSAIGIYLFVQAKLYSEAVLYSYYVIIGFYAWIEWSKKSKKNLDFPIREWSIRLHIFAFVATSIVALLFGLIWDKFTDAQRPIIDSFTTFFSFLATYMEAKKIFSTWYYWIIINLVAAWLYYSRGIEYYPILMIMYFGMSIWGLIVWRNIKISHHSNI